MDKILKLLENGVDFNLAILLLWESLTQKEKSNLTFEQCQWVWGNAPSGSPEKAEAWQLVKAKAEEFLI